MTEVPHAQSGSPEIQIAPAVDDINIRQQVTDFVTQYRTFNPEWFNGKQYTQWNELADQALVDAVAVTEGRTPESVRREPLHTRLRGIYRDYAYIQMQKMNGRNDPQLAECGVSQALGRALLLQTTDFVMSPNAFHMGDIRSAEKDLRLHTQLMTKLPVVPLPQQQKASR